MKKHSIAHDMEMDQTTVSERMITLIGFIPRGKVSTYAQIARVAGAGNAARMVVRILHSSSGKYHLPWHRIVRSSGEIALHPEQGGAEQRSLLLGEGVSFLSEWRVDLRRCGIPDQFFLITRSDSLIS